MKSWLKEHFTRHEIFYHSIRTAVTGVALLIIALVMEIASK